MIMRLLLVSCLWLTFIQAASAAEPAVEELGANGFAQSGDVRIHYVTKGSGPLVVMIHGFPDFWYTWRRQMPALSEKFQVVAIDQRGYNLSDKPEGVDNYRMEKLVEDVVSVLQHLKQDKATIVGHDWGGMVAWSFAMAHPELTEQLVILNLPHPHGLMRELVHNPKQKENSGYARFFQQDGAAATLSAERLADWVKEPEARARYVEAFQKSSFEGMLNYYKANYPKPPYKDLVEPLPKVRCRVLMFHGLKDQALLSPALNGTWDWIDNELTLVTIPNADHFVQHDAPDLVTKTMIRWLSK